MRAYIVLLYCARWLCALVCTHVQNALVNLYSTDTRRLGLCMVINSQKTTWRVTRVILQRVTEIFSTELTTIIILRPEAFWDKQKVENCARLKHYHGVSGSIYSAQRFRLVEKGAAEIDSRDCLDGHSLSRMCMYQLSKV